MINDIRKYLIDSAKKGYASGDTKNWKKEADGSTTITNTSGEFSMHDNFFGGEPYGGRQVIFKNNKVVWIMVYYGQVTDGNPDEVYKILREALSKPDEELPIRGPKLLSTDDYQYSFTWSGNLTKFLGNESISKNGKIVYFANFEGGLVDQRQGD